MENLIKTYMNLRNQYKLLALTEKENSLKHYYKGKFEAYGNIVEDLEELQEGE